ncbi:FAD-dependent oxidoreductase [Bermanella sp. WJH001]|uniref:FAD-dependent oxidoreductase n=1 Tax=Bermanella sp. WJH001 TaxID=3048005 RepID=UPI0024BE1AB2|nr:bifunctional TVP38/TMEM64 family protein/FAD-dependent oxidoreductase [Bermanella sp. WJH001]MDJ1538746.1 FAD-dependent oxidoreductase [Bermanella sp. WJH001]
MKKLLIIAALAAIITALVVFDAQQYLTPDFYQQLFSEQPLLTGAIFFVVYVIATALSIPGAAALTLIGGAIFGLGWGLLLISFASSIGATLAFLMTRLLLKDWVQAKFGNYLTTINNGVEKDGAFYLFTLRLIPVVPFFVINLVMGLMPIKARTFYWVSQVGMLAGTAVYVNAGAQLGQLDELSFAGIMTPGLLGSFVLLAIFPWVARTLINKVKKNRALKAYQKPNTFDDNLLVIGAGAGGLVSSYIAAATKAKVTLIEKHKMGGDCLNTGCVPSKAIIHAASLAHEARGAKSVGVNVGEVDVDFAKVMESVHAGIKDVEPHDSIERYEGLGVNCITGSATIVNPWTVEIETAQGKQTRTARNIIIAAGGRPKVFPIPGIDEVGYYTSDTLWEIKQQPKRLLVIGAGPIGCELAQSFNRLGTTVTMVDPAPHILGREDADVVEEVTAQFKTEGMNLMTGCKPKSFALINGEKQAVIETPEGDQTITFDAMIMAVGREANVKGYGLDNLNIQLDERGNILVDEYLETSMPGVYAVGDVIGGYQFTHVSAHEAWYASVNALFGHLKRFKADYSVIPWATYTDPQVGRVGLNETDAKAKGIAFEVTKFEIKELDRAIVDGQARGFVKVLTVPGKDKILGATIVGAMAGELMAEFVLAMRHGLGLNKILGTIHAYPTMMEANKYVAGEWKRNNAPQKLLQIVEKLHTWRRG